MPHSSLSLSRARSLSLSLSLARVRALSLYPRCPTVPPSFLTVSVIPLRARRRTGLSFARSGQVIHYPGSGTFAELVHFNLTGGGRGEGSHGTASISTVSGPDLTIPHFLGFLPEEPTEPNSWTFKCVAFWPNRTVSAALSPPFACTRARP